MGFIECATFNLNDKKIDDDFTLDANEIISHYNNQYDVERAFRISKTDLKIRPIYHRLEMFFTLLIF